MTEHESSPFKKFGETLLGKRSRLKDEPPCLKEDRIFVSHSPGFILTVDDGRCEVDPGENEESTVEEEEWWEWDGSTGGDRGLWGGRGWWG